MIIDHGCSMSLLQKRKWTRSTSRATIHCGLSPWGNSEYKDWSNLWPQASFFWTRIREALPHQIVCFFNIVQTTFVLGSCWQCGSLWVTLFSDEDWQIGVFIFTRRAGAALQNVELSWHRHCPHWSWHCRQPCWLLRCLSNLLHSSRHLSLVRQLLEPRWGQKCWSAWFHPQTQRGQNPQEAPEN